MRQNIMSIDNYLIDLAKSTANNVSTDIASDLTPEIEPVEESIFSKVGLLQERTQQKLANLSSKSAVVDPSKYNPMQTTVQAMTVTDADTVNLSDTGAMRVLNADAYETTKQDKWFEEPRNVLRMEKQRNELAGELGVPVTQVTNEMVFKVGEQQKQNVQDTMQGTVRDSNGKLLPSLVSADVATNRTGLVVSTNNYGRDLGAVTKLGGMYHTIDTTGNITGERNAAVKLGDTPNTGQTTNSQKTEPAGPLGSISKKYESRGDVATIAPDTHNTTSYGVYQLNSAGTIQNFLQSPEGVKFGKQLAGYEVGTPEFNNRYKKLATNFGPALEQAQEQYIKRTHFDPLNQKAQEFGVDTSDRRVQEALWSQSVQHTPAGNEKILQNAIGKLNNQSTSADLIRALYESRIDYTQGLTTIDAKTKAQLADRYANEYVDVLNAAPTNIDKNKSTIENAAKAFAYTLGEGIANTADLIPEVASYVYGNIVGNKKWSDIKGLYDSEESKAYKEWLGYNDTVVNALGEKATVAAKNAWENGDYEALLNVMGDALTTPELLTTSLGYVAGMILPGAAANKALQLTSKVNKTANAIKAADATGKMTKAEALAIAEKEAGVSYGMLKTMTSNVGFAGEAEQFGRDAEVLYKETYNEEMPIEQKLLIRPLGMLFAKTDALTAKAILMGKDPIAKAVPEMIKALPEAIKVNFAGKMAVIAGSTAVKAAGAFGLEGSTEAIQTAMEKVAGKYKQGEIGIGDVLEQDKYEIAGAGLLGGVGGNQMQVTGAVPRIIVGTPGAVKKGIELATETPMQRDLRQLREYSNPLQEEAISAAATGDYQTVADRVEQVHGKLADELDPSAAKGRTYATILNKAMNKALVDGDGVALDNVYKTMKELHNNKDVEFDIKDVVHKDASQIAQEFVRLINSNTKDTEDVAAKFRGEVDKEANKGSIIEAVEGLRKIAEIKEKRLRSVMGTDLEDSVYAEITELNKTIDEYIKGKGLDDTNKEIAKLGFLVLDPEKGIVSDPSRPGLAVYEEALTEQLLNPTTNRNLLAKELKGTAGAAINGGSRVKLQGLTEFAKSRIDKLNPVRKKQETAYQTQALMGNMLNENAQMGKVIDNVLATAEGLTGLDEAIKQSYIDELTTAKNYVENARNELNRRSAILDTVTKPAELNGALAFRVDKAGNETVEVINKEEGSWKYTKIADVVDGKAVMLDKYADVKEKTVAQPDEVMTKDKFKEAYVQQVKKVIKDKAGKPEELTKEEEQLLANASEDGVLQQVNKELADEVVTESTSPVNEGPLEAVRAKVRQFDKVLSETIKNVPDMLVKQHVKDHYNKKLAELQADKSKLDDMLNRYEALITKRQDKTYSKENGVVLSALKMTMDKLLTKMINAVRRLKSLLKGKNAEYNKLETELKELLEMINSIEKDYITERKTTIGKVKAFDEKLYGKPVVEVGEKRVVAEKRVSKKTGEEVSQQTAINDAINQLAEEKIEELRNELKTAEKGKTSLSAKLIGRLLTNYPMQSAIHDILKRTNDSVFGQIKGNTFADTKLLLEILPKGFKDFFTSKDGSKELLEDFDVMKTYLEKTNISEILINKDRRVYSTSSDKSNTNKYGLVMKNVSKDGVDYNFPVDIIELIGTVKEGKLEIDEQTQNILKFYSAKLLTDTQRMVGLILSMDESEMGQVLGIYDADEQLQVKQDARDGYINSASVRGDIGQEVYQALGIKFNSTTPEFTEESFKAALGVLVQAIAVENNSMEMKSDKGSKNRNLIKTTWDNVPAERNSLIRAMSKLQYMNENRSRPLPSTKKPADRNNRTVMNTQNPIDAKSNEFINKQEKIAYRISPKLKKWLELDETDALKAMGYINVENVDLHASEIDAVLARNDKLVREWNILKTFANGLGDKKFYLNWGQTVSGRFTILNDINYQESKLHREFVVAEGSTIEVDPKSEDGRQMLEASILQGLDMDPDKLSAKTASEKFNKLFKVTDKGIEVTENGAIKEAYDTMREGKFNTEAMAEVFADSEGHHGLSSIELLVEWDRAIRSGEKIKTHANLEIDAITSGMILTLLQIGSDEAVRLAEKGGIYTKDGKEARTAYVKQWLGDDVEFTPGALIEAGKKHAAEIEAKIKTAEGAELTALRKELENDAVFKDLYSTIGVAMIGEVQSYEKKLKDKDNKTDAELQQLAMLEQIGELNLKNIRSIAKSPVMVFIYGATIASIKKKLTYSLGVDTLVKAMKTASKLVKEGKDATKELKFIKQFEPAKGWSYADGLGGKIDKPAEQWKQLLHTDISQEVVETIDKVINATFGTAIETAFESRLGFVNRNRDAIKTVEILMFEAYQIRLSDAVTELLDSKYGKGRHKGETYKISKEELQDINAKLTEQGYGHNIVWNDTDGSVVNQTLNKTGEKGGKYTASVQVGNTKVGGQIKESKPVVNTGAAPTISIHAIDGRMMLDVLNREVKGYTGGNVYDAVVLSLDKAMLNDTADTYNTNMIETGFSRSILVDQLATLENMLSTMTDKQKKLMFANIGLRPEGTLRDDYTKEVNRLKLGIGKMLELLENAKRVNEERLTNSAKGYSVGHLFQMGAGIVDVEANETRAKALPVIETVKRLLENKHAQDRKVTEKEFGVKADYVFNLDDIAKGETQIQSKANIAQISTGEYIKLADKLWDSLSSKDVVAIIGDYKVPEKADSKSKAYSKILKGILKSNANILDGTLSKEQLENSGRVLVDGVWTKAEAKVESDALSEELIKESPIKDTTKIEYEFTKAELSWVLARLADGLDEEAMEYLNKNTALAVRELDNAIMDYNEEIVYAKEDGDKEVVREFLQAVKNLNKAKEAIKEQQQQEVDIIQPSEMFTKNINKMMKC